MRNSFNFDICDIFIIFDRFKALHAQHHHAQFEMYEKLVKAQELIQKMEEEIECKNKTIHKLSLRQVSKALFFLIVRTKT